MNKTKGLVIDIGVLLLLIHDTLKNVFNVSVTIPGTYKSKENETSKPMISHEFVFQDPICIILFCFVTVFVICTLEQICPDFL